MLGHVGQRLGHDVGERDGRLIRYRLTASPVAALLDI
jgi:hypothetical protein